MSTATLPLPVACDGDYAQFLLEVLPDQGRWTEESYLWLTDSARRLVELTDGVIEVLPKPTREHQLTVRRLLDRFAAHVEPAGRLVIFSPVRLLVRTGKFREPDLLVLKFANDPRSENRYFTGADLVIEVASPDKPGRDLVEKPVDYADGKIPEYWIVNPLDDTITVLTLEGSRYHVHGSFKLGESATSVILSGFAVDVATVLGKK